MSVAILVPVLDRPHRATPLLKSIRATTPDATVLFVCSSDDHEEIAAVKLACKAHRGGFVVFDGNYAAKIRAGIETTTESLIFTGADDLKPHPGWFEAARACLKDGVEVVGVNDLLTRSREHATHFLMTRAYAERATIDGHPGPLFEGYSHWFCDNELIATACKRGTYVYCEESVVEHRHPMAGTAPDDATYERGRAKRHADGVLFKRRRRLWT